MKQYSEKKADTDKNVCSNLAPESKKEKFEALIKNYMKKILVLLFVILSSNISHAQTANAILFTENGEKFSVILNGMRQNDKPETNVRITGLKAEFFKLKVIFDSRNLGEKNFNLAVQFGMESSYCIKKNSKGEYVLRMISEVPVEQSTAPAHSTVIYNENPAGVAVEQTTTTTTTTTAGDPDNVNVNFNMNAGDNGAGISFNVSGADVQSSSSSTTITHSQTTTTTVSGTPPAPPRPSYLPGYKGPVGCDNPMTPDRFSSLLQSVKSKSFEETKMTIAKQALNNQCLFVSQVKSILDLFSFEETKLEFAKYAYQYTYDLGNFFQVNDAFTFESSSDELNQYIQSH